MEQIAPDISDLDLIRLYRDSWMVGNGKVNFDSFFLAANENNFFVKQMMIKSFNSQPCLDHKNEIDTTFSISNDQLEQ